MKALVCISFAVILAVAFNEIPSSEARPRGGGFGGFARRAGDAARKGLARVRDLVRRKIPAVEHAARDLTKQIRSIPDVKGEAGNLFREAKRVLLSAKRKLTQGLGFVKPGGGGRWKEGLGLFKRGLQMTKEGGNLLTRARSAYAKVRPAIKRAKNGALAGGLTGLVLEGREGLKDLADSEDVAAITDFLKDFS